MQQGFDQLGGALPGAEAAQIPAVALVLGAMVQADGSPSAAMIRRTEHAIALWRAGQVSTLILSGGGDGLTEAKAMERLCRAAGLPASALYLEERSSSTAENLRLSHPILLHLGWPRLVIVSDPWHLKRALMSARRMGIRASGSAPVLQRPPRRWLLLRETMARIFYALTLWR